MKTVRQCHLPRSYSHLGISGCWMHERAHHFSALNTHNSPTFLYLCLKWNILVRWLWMEKKLLLFSLSLSLLFFFPNETSQQAAASMCTLTENWLFIVLVHRTKQFWPSFIVSEPSERSIFVPLQAHTHRGGEQNMLKQKKWCWRVFCFMFRTLFKPRTLFIFDIRCFMSQFMCVIGAEYSEWKKDREWGRKKPSPSDSSGARGTIFRPWKALK